MNLAVETSFINNFAELEHFHYNFLMLATRINYLLICMLIDIKMAIKWFCENHKCNFYSVNYKKNMLVSDLCSGCFEIKFPSVSDVFTVTEAGRVKEMYHPKHCITLLLDGMITVLL